MKFLFRVDATHELGLGHLVRCLTLAAHLREQEHDVAFVGRYLGDAAARLARTGHRVVDLPHDVTLPARIAVQEWRHPAQESEADATLHALHGLGGFDWLVVDVYALDAAWEHRMRSAVRRIMVIDDLANRAHDCDLLLDQNFFLDPLHRYDGLVPPACSTLLGPRYALLRREFAAARAALTARPCAVRRVLVSFGGHDMFGITRKALGAIEDAGLQGLGVDVVTNAANPDFSAIEQQCLEHESWRLHASPDMAALMARADLAIGAGGIMNWERACLNLPCVLVSLTENQVPIARDLAHEGACVYLGSANEVSKVRLGDVLRGLAAAPALARALGARSGKLVDGDGARRVVRRLVSEAIKLRPARPDDAGRIYQWRNDAETRRYSLDSAPLCFDRHVQWLERALANPQISLLVAERANEPLGVLRYDLECGTARISVYLVPGHAGRGLGGSLIDAGTHWLRARHPKIRRIVAEIHPDNRASLGAFAKAGFLAHTHVYVHRLDDDAS